MNKESAIVNTNLRLNLNREADRLAWDYLQNRDKHQYPSYSKTIVIALNDFFRRQEQLAEDPFLESREREDAFCRKLSATLLHDLEPILEGINVRPAASTPASLSDLKEKPTDLEQRNRELAERALSIFG